MIKTVPDMPEGGVSSAYAAMPGAEVRQDGSVVVMTTEGKLTIGPGGGMTLEANNGDYVTKLGGKTTTVKQDGTTIVEKDGIFGKTVEQYGPDGKLQEKSDGLVGGMLKGMLALTGAAAMGRALSGPNQKLSIFGVAAIGAFDAQNQALGGTKPFQTMHDASIALNTLATDMKLKPPAPKPSLGNMLGM